MNYTEILENTKQYIIHFINTHPNDTLLYHNLTHTEDVVKAASRIGRYYQLSDQDFFIVIAAAWFHDAGYYNGPAQGHEQRAAEMAAAFLKEKDVEESIIGSVEQCILATRMPQSPETLLEQIVCDADLSHLGTDNFSKRNKLLRKETEITHNKDISKEEWRQNSIVFLESHHYHSDYGKQLFDEKKQQNIEELKKKIAEEESIVSAPANNVPLPEAVKNKKPKSDRPERGIETMFRISSNNHQRLSDMADNKAHIMITTTSIIISVLLSVLLRKLEDNPNLIIPTILLLAVCVITMVFSILATRPSIPHGTFTQDDISAKKVNLLFFGNFYRMNYEDYAGGMEQMMNDRDFLYGSLTRDVYSQGVVLGRKYRLLRVGYNVFMFGIVASVLAFVIAVVLFGH